MRSLIDIQDLAPQEIDELISVANDIIENPKKYSEVQIHHLFHSGLQRRSPRQYVRFSYGIRITIHHK